MWSHVLLAATCWTWIASSALSQVQLPEGNLNDRITIAADGGTHWVEGVYDVYLLEGNCYVNQGLTYARSKQAVLWVERGGPNGEPPHKLIAYLEGDVEINYQADGKNQPGESQTIGTATLKDRQWFGRFYSALPVEVTPISFAAPPQAKPELYWRGAANLGLSPPGQVRPAQFAEPIAPPPRTITPPTDTRRVRVLPRATQTWN